MQLHCPNCGSALNIVTRQGIEIDVCPSCGGVWLDHGELDKIVSRSAEQHHRSYHGEGIYTDDVQKRKRGKPRRKKDERYEARYRDDDRRRRDDDDVETRELVDVGGRERDAVLPGDGRHALGIRRAEPTHVDARAAEVV